MKRKTDSRKKPADIKRKMAMTTRDRTTRPIIPLYRPSARVPSIKEMVDTGKRDELVREIDSTEGIPEEVRAFLKLASARHLRFHYKKIADFYSHADARVKRLFENSALVVVDVGRAAENGYVRFSSELDRLFGIWEAQDRTEG